MKKSLLFIGMILLSTMVCAEKFNPPRFVYNGDTLPLNDEYRRLQCGAVKTSVLLPEVSGIACSRVTPGYLWMQSDDIESYIVATTELGQRLFMKVKFSKTIRWDWEDMCGGEYEGANYLFIGAFGDNEETDGNYSIVYFEEPEITPDTPEITITPKQIKFVYPDGNKHNCEALMYDNVEQMLYIITKVYYNVCQVFSLPMSLEYGTNTQTLTYICDLGVKSDLGAGSNPSRGFHLVTGADISPDGSRVLIKNHNNTYTAYSTILIWKRDGNESLSQTLLRQPEQIKEYKTEWQGEAICWLDDDTFYTTSDADDGNPPIFKYTRRWGEDIENVTAEQANKLVMIDRVLYVRTDQGLYSLDGRKVQ